MQQHGRFALQADRAAQPIGVPDPERGHGRRARRCPGRVVADAVAGLHPADAHHLCAQRDRRLARRRTARGCAIQINARTDRIERERSAAERCGAVRHVEQRRPSGQAPHRNPEALELRLGRAVAPVGRMKMRVAALEVRRVEQIGERLDLVPAHARASHPRVDLQVERAALRSASNPGVDARPVIEHRGQPVRVVGVEHLRSGRQEHEHRARDPGGPQLDAFFDGRHGVAPRIHGFQRPGNSDGSDPICVGLHHREEPRARDPSHRPRVLDHGAEVHLDPRPGLLPAD